MLRSARISALVQGRTRTVLLPTDHPLSNRYEYRNKQIFLDLKLHDIPRTVERAVQAAARHGVGLLTIHAGGGRAMIQAAVEGARSTGDGTTKIIAVTALTSLSNNDLHETGVAGSTADHVLRLGDLAPFGRGGRSSLLTPWK
jgi:orotidine-5'-phosphate decarboxylase